MKRIVMRLKTFFRRNEKRADIKYNACLPLSRAEKAAYRTNKEKPV